MAIKSDVELNHVCLRLDPGNEKMPFQPVLQAFRGDVSPDGFQKVVAKAIDLAGGRLPVDVELLGTELVEGGAIIRARAKKGILRAEVEARIGIQSVGPETIRVTVEDIDAPVWVPTDLAMRIAMEKVGSRPGVTAAPGDKPGVDIDPELILDALSLPAVIQRPGIWAVFPTAASIGLEYSAVGF